MVKSIFPASHDVAFVQVLVIEILGAGGIVQLTGPVEADAESPLAVTVTDAPAFVTVEPAEPEIVQVLVMT